MSERINNLLFQVLSRIISTKVFWSALGLIIVISARGIWYASATYSRLDSIATNVIAIEVKIDQVNGRLRDFEHRLIRLEVKAGIAAKPITETAEATN